MWGQNALCKLKRVKAEPDLKNVGESRYTVYMHRGK